MRSNLYRLASLLGTFNAIRRGRIIPRLFNIMWGRNVVRKTWWK